MFCNSSKPFFRGWLLTNTPQYLITHSNPFPACPAATHQGISIPDHLLDRMNPAVMDDTFSRASRLGLDPSQLFTKLMAHPRLLEKLQQPRVMTAFLDISEDPARQAKYEADQELLDVVYKVW